MAITTIAERRLIKETRRALGAPLCTFLLAGYGDDEIMQSRFFSILSKSQRFEQKRLLRITTVDPLGLPHDEEPLVLLALLHLLEYKDDGTGVNPIIPFPIPEIWRILEWKNSDKTNRIIHSAIRKYFNLAYTRVDDLSHNFPDATEFTGNALRLIVSYMFSDESDSEDWGNDLTCMEIEFNEKLVGGLWEKQFLGMSWDTISSMKAILRKPKQS